MRIQVPKINVLLIEDDEDKLVIIGDFLSQVRHSDFRLDWFADLDAGLEAILEGKYDVCSSTSLGDRDGLEFIREATLRDSLVPIIFLTGWDNLETDLQAMKEGASDYLVKGQLSPSLLERSIRNTIERNQREKEFLSYQNRLEKLVEERTAELVTAKEKAKRWAEQISLKEERYRSVFENSMADLMLTAPDRSFFAANPEACRTSTTGD